MLNQMQDTVQLLIAADLPLAMVRPLQVWRVYDNIISNALQYNRPRLDITLNAIQQGNYLHCTISDDGQGIRTLGAEDATSISHKHRIFARYSRGINHRQPLHLGLGSTSVSKSSKLMAAKLKSRVNSTKILRSGLRCL